MAAPVLLRLAVVVALAHSRPAGATDELQALRDENARLRATIDSAVHKGQNFMNWGSITRACHPEFAAKMWLRGCVCVLL